MVGHADCSKGGRKMVYKKIGSRYVIRLDKREVYLHLYINLSDSNLNTWGGHLNTAYVGGTCEIVIDVIDGELDREYNKHVGLNLLKVTDS